MDPDDDRTFFERHGLPIIAVVLLVLAGVGFVAFRKSAGELSRKPAKVKMVEIIAPPPPPPPSTPPPTPPPQERPPEPENKAPEFVEQEAIPDKPTEEPAAQDEAMGTNVVGDGSSNAFGLKAGGGAGRIGGRRGGRGGGKYGAYASQVQSRVAEALRSNPATRSAEIRVDVRIWADATGRVSRARLARSTGDNALDRAIQDQVLTGLQLTEPPPSDMPMPIVMRLTARRP
jgi:TonB family protein